MRMKKPLIMESTIMMQPMTTDALSVLRLRQAVVSARAAHRVRSVGLGYEEPVRSGSNCSKLGRKGAVNALESSPHHPGAQG